MQVENLKKITAIGKKVVLATALGAVALLGAAKAQELVKGAFTLTADTRFGSTILPAGHYTVSIAPVTEMTASGTRLLVFVRPDSQPGPVASILALASAEACASISGLPFATESNARSARALCFM